MNWKRNLQIEKANSDNAELALMAWKVLGGLAAAAVVIAIVGSVPEVVRYLKLKSM